MADITIGNVEFRSNGRTLTITSCDRPSMSISLDRSCLEDLLEFVSSIVDAECDFNRRQAFRVPLWDSCGLHVEIRKAKDIVHEVRPTDISLTGIFVQYRPEEEVDLSVDDCVNVAMTFRGNTHLYRAVVRRCERHGAGLFFPTSMQAEQISPPSGITQIVMELQRRWMSRNWHQTP